MKFEFVDDAKHLWRRWSTRVAASQAGLVVFWIGLPREWKHAIPDWIITIAVGVFAVAFISAQSVKQPSLQALRDALSNDGKDEGKKDVG